jgi:hypothetical protein
VGRGGCTLGPGAFGIPNGLGCDSGRLTAASACAAPNPKQQASRRCQPLVHRCVRLACRARRGGAPVGQRTCNIRTRSRWHAQTPPRQLQQRYWSHQLVI